MVRMDRFWVTAARLVLRWAGACWAVCLAITHAHALEGGLGPAEPTADMPLVGSLAVDGKLFSAVLIGPRHVLTAAHVVAGSAPEKVVFRTPLAGAQVLPAQWIWVNPAYTGKASDKLAGDPTVHADIAVVKLAKEVPAVLRSAPVWTGSITGRLVTLVSHGGSTTLITSGINRVDAVFTGSQGQPATYLFDFDGHDLSSNALGPALPANGSLGAGREASLVKGDSGSAAFVFEDGEWHLAGINTFELRIGLNRGAGGVVLASHRHWIEESLAAQRPAAASPIANPQSTVPDLPLPVPFKP
jgi:hypothetical protein